MKLRDLIRNQRTDETATAIPATPATDPAATLQSVAKIATVAVANTDEPANGSPDDERIARMVRKLEENPGIAYAIETHDEIEPDAVLLTLAIRGNASGELRIPKSRYDAFALLDLIERHTTRRTLQ